MHSSWNCTCHLLNEDSRTPHHLCHTIFHAPSSSRNVALINQTVPMCKIQILLVYNLENSRLGSFLNIVSRNNLLHRIKFYCFVLIHYFLKLPSYCFCFPVSCLVAQELRFVSERRVQSGSSLSLFPAALGETA